MVDSDYAAEGNGQAVVVAHYKSVSELPDDDFPGRNLPRPLCGVLVAWQPAPLHICQIYAEEIRFWQPNGQDAVTVVRRSYAVGELESGNASLRV